MKLTLGRALPALAIIAIAWLLAPARAQKPEGKPAAAAIELPGQVVPHAQANLHALVAGVVQVVAADIGDAVKKDQILARLSAPELEFAVEQKKAREELARVGIEQAKRNVEIIEAAMSLVRAQTHEAEAGLSRAKAEHQFAKAKHERMKTLAAQGGASREALDESAHAIKSATAALAQAEAKVKGTEANQAETLAKRDKAVTDVKAAEVGLLVARTDTRRAQATLQATEIRAPFDGVIVRRSVDIGETVGVPGAKQTPLFTLAQLDRVRIVFHVPEKHVSSVAAGMPLKIRFEKRVVEAKVSRIGVALDAKGKERTLRAEIELPNPQRELLTGSSATVVIRVDKE